MVHIYKLITLNINGIAQLPHLDRLGDFLRRHEIDIALLQEVTTLRLNDTQHYTAYINIGTELRGTAILTKHRITLTNIKRLPCGRGIAGLFQNTWIINVYAPSGEEKRDARECFYTTDVISLIPLTRHAIILAGDFNCVLRKTDATGRKNVSKALDILVSGLKLHDAYGHIKTDPIFTT
jgi:exonuclease III